METLMSRLIFNNWQRKCIALIAAIIVWLLVNHSILATKTIPNIPIRIVNIPVNKTIVGLLPNRILSRRVALTLSGSKDVIAELESGDLEVVLDASTADSDEWLVQINKKNLVNLNPSIDVVSHITQVKHTEFVIKLSRLVTEKIAITIPNPIGKSPEGYDFLDIWPQRLFQTLSGAEEEIQKLKAEGGLERIFNLNDISKNELDDLKNSYLNSHNDEISFFIPNKWKRIAIPFNNKTLEEINDPEAHNLRIDFLRKTLHAIENPIPITVFYPEKYVETINPQTYPLATSNSIEKKYEITLFTEKLYVKDVSRLFLDIISNNLEIVIVAAPKNEREILHWSVDVVDPHELEDIYVAYLITNSPTNKGSSSEGSKYHELILRNRFREYMQRLMLYTAPEHRLKLESHLVNNEIKVIATSKKEAKPR